MFDWLKAQKDMPVPSTEGGGDLGHSGYLSAPSATLDPHLFDGETLKPSVRNDLVTRLVRYLLADVHLHDVHDWIRLWLAGSGVTYQWAGNTDLDVLLGVSRGKFNRANPDWAHYTDDDLAAALNATLRAHLWPTTSGLKYGGQAYEVTFFYNTGMGTNIKRINPYAAYDIMTDHWVVRPPQLPHDPASLYPREWFERADQDAQYAVSLLARYTRHTRALEASPPGSPGHTNHGAALNLVTSQAQALFDDLHHGRRAAFQGGGEGYGDWHNFRWQMAKASGAAKGLYEVTGVAHKARELSETELYGGPLEAADELVRRAQRFHG